MAEFLPNAVNYAEPLAVLPPDAQNFNVACVPSNGSSFGPSSIIQVDLGSRSFLDPASLMIRYKWTSTSAAATNTKLVGTPAYTPFLRLETFVNSQSIESINNYNTVANLLTNLQLSVSDKLGQQAALNYVDPTTTPVTNEALDGRLCATAGETNWCAAPLHCSLSYSEKLIPLFAMGGVRLQFTLDTLANMCSNLNGDAASALTGYTITNFEVVYNCVDLGAAAQAEVIRMNPKIKIKSQSFSTSISPVASGSSGSQNLIFNQRFASVKSAYLNMGGTDTLKSANKNMDSYDITSSNGDYQLNIGGVCYPQKALSTINNRAGILQELRRSMNTIFGSNVSMSINALEFGKWSTNTTSYDVPAKFWVGVNLQKLSIPQKAFFTGISTQNSPITAVINIGTATSQLHNVMLILNYDMIFEIDPMTKQIVVVQ
jgi:hypothetical protein